jgi:hypothetical protein
LPSREWALVAGEHERERDTAADEVYRSEYPVLGGGACNLDGATLYARRQPGGSASTNGLVKLHFGCDGRRGGRVLVAADSRARFCDFVVRNDVVVGNRDRIEESVAGRAVRAILSA